MIELIVIEFKLLLKFIELMTGRIGSKFAS